MNLKNKKVLVIGLGVSGTSTIKSLDKLGAKIYLSERSKEASLSEDLEKLNHIDMESYFEGNYPNLDGFDLVVKNPGVAFDNEIIIEAESKGIDVVSDLELAYRLDLTRNLIVITGTNGKTTTTSLVGEIFKEAEKETHVMGNIGIGILWELYNSKKDDIAVVEASSFQLNACSQLKPKVSCFLNISEDHLNWHKTFDNYFQSKQNVFRNQDKNDFLVLNYDDEKLRALIPSIKTNLICFSREEILDSGVFLIEDKLVVKEGANIETIISRNDLKILGNHNVENALAAIGICKAMGLESEKIREGLKKFKSVEHRIEYVSSIGGVRFYNDSKGTNIDASIKAIEAVEKNIILIAGGANKDSSYHDLIESFKGRVKTMILFGETKYDMDKAARNLGFMETYIVDDMEQAVKKAYSLASEGDNVLLSPACASLDMYRGFEERGRDFKDKVSLIKEG